MNQGLATTDKAWHTLSPSEVAALWGSHLQHGHTSARAAQLLEQVGPNQLAEKPPPSLITRFFRQIADATVLALLVAAALSALVGMIQGHPGESFLLRHSDEIAILIIVVLNALLGMVQEKRAEKALASLRQMSNPMAVVQREGKLREIPAAELVPGDLLTIREGDRLPADVRVVQAQDLEVSEAALTGESNAVHKSAADSLPESTPLAERTNMAFMGTEVAGGRGAAVVASTGMSTELGLIAGLLASVKLEPTPLQRYLNRFGRQIVVACVLISAVVMVAGLLRGSQTLRELVLTAVSLAVAAIPEGLPAITAIVLALGTQRMARRNALVRRLPAVEGLGSAQIICTDKTGTLTQNAMTVRLVHVADETFHVTGTARSSRGELLPDVDGTPGAAISPSDNPRLWAALNHAAYAPGARIDSGDQQGELEVAGNPTDSALRVLAIKGGVAAAHSPEVKHELPFSSCRKIGTVVAQVDGRPLALVRGAPEIIIDRSVAVLTGNGERPMDERQREQWLDVAVSWGARAMRVVALAQRSDIEPPKDNPDAKIDLEERLTLIGLVGIVDPPRPEVKSAIAEAHGAGISTMMITGDQPATARAIAEELDLCRAKAPEVITGSQIDLLDQKELEARVEQLDVVARATPTHKLRIVEALKARGLVCAMTGDGVNDAPAVKAASIGVAMGCAGTDVTKEAADLVLADDNYATIVAAVEEGRSIFNNIKKFIFFLLSSNTGIVLAVFAGGLLGWAPPLAPIQILWINLVTNGLPALALGVEPTEPRLMQRPPRDPRQAILGKQEYLTMLAAGSIMAVGALGVFAWLMGDPGNTESPTFRLAQTGCFAVLSLSPMFHAFNCRSARVSNWHIGWFSNRPLWGAVAIGLALIALAVYVPALRPVFRTDVLTVAHLIPITVVSAIPLLLVEPYKMVLRAHRR